MVATSTAGPGEGTALPDDVTIERLTPAENVDYGAGPGETVLRVEWTLPLADADTCWMQVADEDAIDVINHL